jgi:hypothetical protein
MMARTQVALDPEVQRQARARATQLGISLAEYIRGLVARDVGQPHQQSDPSVVFNLGRSAMPSNVAKDKDRMVGEAIAARHGRRGARG